MKTDQTISKQNIWSYLEEVIDPEIPVLNVVEMGIVRDVEFEGDQVVVKITPTYSGCPAMNAIEM
ncbi:MAG: iron-sulfur cluster assembly protein, partial [Rhodohalobacter sp.]